MILDFHTHCFPNNLSKRAITKLAYASGGLYPFTDGTSASLDAFMHSQGVSAYVVLNIATNPSQMKNVNDFAASLKSDTVFPFGSVHPDAPDALEEIERIKELGLYGIKFHPEYQNFFVDDEKMRPIYKKISETGLIVSFHAGEDYGFRAPFHCTPTRLVKALKWLDCPVVAAHWGGVGMGQEVLKYLCGLPLYFDMSFGYAARSRLEAMDIVERHGTKKLLFASDCPWHSPKDEMRLISTLELDKTDINDILWNNGIKLLKQVHEENKLTRFMK